jgi:hypothetical protein
VVLSNQVGKHPEQSRVAAWPGTEVLVKLSRVAWTRSEAQLQDGRCPRIPGGSAYGIGSCGEEFRLWRYAFEVSPHVWLKNRAGR